MIGSRLNRPHNILQEAAVIEKQVGGKEGLTKAAWHCSRFGTGDGCTMIVLYCCSSMLLIDR